MLKRITSSVLVAFLAILLTITIVLAQTWAFRFPTTVIDTGAVSRTYYPVSLGYGGQTLVDAGYINANALNTNMQISSDNIHYMVSANNILTSIPNLPASGKVTTNLYTGYAPVQTDFDVIVGENGYITTLDEAQLELGADFIIEQSGYFDTSTGNYSKNLIYKEDAYKTWVRNTNEIAASVLTHDLEIEQAAGAFGQAVIGVNWFGQTFTTLDYDSSLSRFGLSVTAIFGAPVGDFTVSIRNTVGNLPTGADLASATVDASTLAVGWNYFDLSYDMTGGTVYAITFRHPTSDATNHYTFNFNNANPYAGGQFVNSGDSGVTWAPTAGSDFLFRVYSSPTILGTVISGDQIITTSIDDTPTSLSSYSTTASVNLDVGAGVVPAMILLTQTLAAPAASVTFSNIDTLVAQWDAMATVTSRHLVISINAQSADAVNQRDVEIQFNGDATAVYNYDYFDGSGALVGANTVTGVNQIVAFPIPGTAIHASAFGGGTVLIPHAFNTANHKTLVSLGGAVEDEVEAVSGRWADISAITSLLLEPDAGNFATGSRFILAVVDERYLVEEDNLVAPGDMDFNGISGIGYDLAVIGYLRSERANNLDTIDIGINGGVGNYFWQRCESNLIASNGAGDDVGRVVGDTATANAFSPYLGYFPYYAGTVDEMVYFSLTGIHDAIVPLGRVSLYSGRCDVLGAITRLHFDPENAPRDFSVGSLMSLYRVPRYTIDRQVLAGIQAAITFAGIPAGSGNLQVVVYARSTAAGAGDTVDIQFNVDVGPATYDTQFLDGVGAVGPTAGQNPADRVVLPITAAAAAGARAYGGGIITIYDYAEADRHKHYTSFGCRSEEEVEIRSCRWEDTTAINQIILTPTAGPNFTAGSVFELVGSMPNRLFMMDDGTDILASGVGNITVPNNANNWIVNQGNAISYMEYLKITTAIGGVSEKLHYQPNTMVMGQDLTSYPVVKEANSNTNALGTLHTINLPDGITTGDLLIAMMGCTGNPAITWPADWTELDSTAAGVLTTLTTGYKIAEANEAHTVVVTTAVAATSSCQSFGIIHYQGVPETVPAGAVGAPAANPDPPNLAPTTGNTTYRWFAFCVDDVDITGTQAAYDSYVKTGTTPYLASTRNTTTALQENPLQFTAAAGGTWVANTISIQGEGTATFTNASVDVVGTGTNWTDAMDGSVIWSDTDLDGHVIDSVTDVTNLVLTAIYAGGGGLHNYTTAPRIVDRDAGDGLQDGAITWGSNTDLTIHYGEMESYESTTAAAVGVEGFVMPTSPLPSTWTTTGGGLTNLPMYDTIANVAGQLGYPDLQEGVQAIYFFIIVGFAFAVFMAVVMYTRSAFMAVLAMSIVLFVGSSMTVIPMWVPFMIMIADLGVMFLYKRVAY